MFNLTKGAVNHVSIFEELHLRIHQACIDVKGVALRVADAHVIYLRQLAYGLSYRSYSTVVIIWPLHVELLNYFVQRTEYLHVPKLSVAIQVFILLLIFGVAELLNQVLYDQ